MKFYDWIEEKELDEAFQQGLDELKATEVQEEYIQLTEEQKKQMNEAVLSVTFIISLILGAPSLIKAITKAIGWVYKKIKKLFGGKEESKVAERIIQLTEKWHNAYVTALRHILKVGGVFKAAGITDKEKQEKATEVVFYTIILGFAVHGGFTTAQSIIKMIQHSSTSHAHVTTMEAVLTAIKSKEVKNFIAQVGAAA